MVAEDVKKIKSHLVIFIHGLDGHPSDLAYISTQLGQKFPARTIIHIVDRSWKTRQGIDKLGHSVALEVRKCVSKLLESGVVVKYMSFLGHSMGGLVARYAMGELYAEKFFDDITPVNFATFATPHLGASAPLGQSLSRRISLGAYNWIGPTVAGGRSGAQLFLADDYEGRPLLVAMSEEESDYFQALKLFPYRSLYANVAGDFLVPYFTGAIFPFNFTTDVYPHVLGYDPVIFDINTQMLSEDQSSPKPNVKEEFKLNDSQLFIMKSLNSLGWAKYPVHVNSSWNPHTAILVCKAPRQDNCLGRVVVRHYIDHFIESMDA